MPDRSDAGPLGIALELAGVAVDRIDSALQLVEQGGETNALTYVVELRSWLIRPDPFKEWARTVTLESLRQIGIGDPDAFAVQLAALRHIEGVILCQAAL
jgi:hypothetical protein